MSSIDEAREKVRAFRTEVESAKSHAYEMNRLLTTYLALARRLGNEDLAVLIGVFQKARITIEMAYRSLMAFYTISGPVGWLIGIGGLVVTGLMLADSMELRRPTY